MKKSVVVRGPVLSQSGYGEHARLVLRALRTRESDVDIFIIPTGWGETGWLCEMNEERKWIDKRVIATNEFLEAKRQFDISVQVTIPNEWDRMAPINIGVTAGIESNRVSPVWVEKSNYMNKVITISKHSKDGFMNAVFQGHNKETGQPMSLKMQTEVDVVGYPVKDYEESQIELKLEHDFNYLAVAQWGPRKNLSKIIKWFVEENYDQEVGLIIKTSIKNNSIVDRSYAAQLIHDTLSDSPKDRKCKIYLLHGDLTEQEMHAVYNHDKVKCLVSLTHGEGFGLPLFEAAYSGLPVIAPGWSGQCDFLFAPSQTKSKNKKKKNVLKPFFAKVDFTIGPVPESAVWPGVIEKDTMWCYPSEGSYKLRLRQVRKEYNKWLERASYLKSWVREEFNKDKIYSSLCDSILPKEITEEEVDSLFDELLAGT